MLSSLPLVAALDVFGMLGITKPQALLLIAAGVVVYFFWPKIQAFLQQQGISTTTTASAATGTQQRTPSAHAAVDVKAIKELKAERDRINAEFSATMNELRSLLEQESQPRA